MKQSQTSLGEMGLKVLCYVLLVAVTLVVYWPVRQFEFIILDDAAYVLEVPAVLAGLSGRGVVWAFTNLSAGFWHPMAWLSHMLDMQLYGLKPGSHHLTSLVIHVATTLLLLLTLSRMTGAFWRSAVVAALFALHPLHVESVAWVAERKDVLSTFFFMLTLWAYVRYVRKLEARRPKTEAKFLTSGLRPLVSGSYWIVVLCFALGLMSKAMLVTLPFVLLLLDWWPLNRIKPAWVELREKGWCLLSEKLPLVALAGVVSIVTFRAEKNVGALSYPGGPEFSMRMANALVSYVHYLRRTLWPDDLAVFYPYPESFPAWQWVVAGTLLLAATALVIWQKRRPWLAVGWLWYLGTLVPVIGLIQVGQHSMADRYTYIPLVGFFIMAVWGINEFAARWRWAKPVLAAVVGVCLATLVICCRQQVGYWHNSRALFEHALVVTQNNYLAHDNVGIVSAVEGRRPEARAHFLSALRIKDDDLMALNNLGWILATDHDAEFRDGAKAVQLAERAVKLTGSKDAGALDTLAAAYAETGRFSEAVKTAQQALELAEAAGRKTLATQVSTHLQLYQSGQPCRE